MSNNQTRTLDEWQWLRDELTRRGGARRRGRLVGCVGAHSTGSHYLSQEGTQIVRGAT